ncbi:MAG: hypothetical protein K4571_08360 [Deltaproteobacteria bacterium]
MKTLQETESQPGSVLEAEPASAAHAPPLPVRRVKVVDIGESIYKETGPDHQKWSSGMRGSRKTKELKLEKIYIDGGVGMICRRQLTKCSISIALLLCFFFVSSAGATKWRITNNSANTIRVQIKCNGLDKFVETAPGGYKEGMDTSCEWGQFRWQTVTQSGIYTQYGELLYCSYNCCSTGIGDTASVTLQSSNPKCHVIWSK